MHRPIRHFVSDPTSFHPPRRVRVGAVLAPVLAAALGALVPASGGDAATGARRIHLSFDVARITWSPADGGVRPDLPGGAHVAASGLFDLPVIPVPVRAPEGTRLAGAVVVGERRVPVTAPAPVVRIPAGNSSPRTSRLLQEAATVVPVGYERGERVDAVVVSPFRVNEAGEVDLAVSLDLELRFEPQAGEDVAVPRRAREPAGVVASAAAPEAAPGAFLPTSRPSIDGSPVPYVIVTGSDLVSEFQRLADWRTRAGTPAVVRDMDWVLANYHTGVDDAENLRLFLREAYELWGTETVLLAGDSQVVPIRYGRTTWFGGEEIPTDLYYQCLDGSWNGDGDVQFGEGTINGVGGDDADILPEIEVGRLPVTTPEQARTVVDKIIGYESSPPVSGDYPASALLLAEVLFPQGWHPGDDVFQDGGEYAETTLNALPASFVTKRLYENFPAYPGSLPESLSTVIPEMNRGYGIVHHVGHGYHDNMSVGQDESIRISHVDALHNGNRLFFLYSINCTSSAVDLDAIGEHYLYNPNGGAVASVGSTRFDFPGTSQVYDETFYRVLFPETGSAPPLGEATTLSKTPFASLAIEDRTHRWTYFTLMYFGDPLTRLWTAVPLALAGQHPATVALGESVVTVRATAPGGAAAGARVTLVKSGEVFGTGITDAAGSASIRVRPLTEGTLDVTVTAENHIPYRGSITVGPAVGPYLVLDGWSVGAAGNSRDDNRLFVGETTEIEFRLRNAGSTALSGLDVTAGADLVGMEFTPVSVTPTALAPGETARFRAMVVVPGDIADGATARIALTAIAAGRTWSIPAAIGIASPELALYELSLEEREGDGDGVVEAGETANVSVVLLNRGSTDAGAVSGTLDLNPPRGAELLQDTTAFGAVPAGVAQGSQTPFVIRMGSTGRPGLRFVAQGSGRELFHADLDLDPPGAPTNLEAAGETNNIRITWKQSSARDVARYVVLRSEQEEGPFVRVSHFTEYPTSLYLDRALPDLAVRFYRIAAQDSSGNLSPYSLPVRGTTSLPRLPGFPLVTDQGSTTTPVTADIDGDGVLDVFAGGHQVFGFHADGTELRDGDHDARTLGPWSNKLSEFGWWGSPAIGDLDGDGRMEVVGTTAKEGQVFVWDSNGALLPGWPRNTGPVDGSWALGAPSLVDLTGDGLPEIVLHAYRSIYAFDRFGNEVRDGDGIPSTKGVFFTSGSTASYASVAAADFDHDGREEIVFPTRSGLLYLLDDDGTPMPGFPVEAGESVSSPALADLDGDGHYEIIFGTRTDSLQVFHDDGTRAAGWPRFVFLNEDIQSSPAVGDLDGDGELEIAIVAANTTLLLFRPDGTVISATRFRDSGGGSMTARGSPALGNLDDDDDLEVAFTNQSGWVYALNRDGSLVPGFPLKVGGAIEGGVLLTDLDGDGMNELCFAGFDRQISVYRTLGRVVSRPTWSMFQHDPAHTGRIDAPVVLAAPPRLGLAVLQSPQLPETAGLYVSSTWALDGPAALEVDGAAVEGAAVPGQPRLYRAQHELGAGSHVFTAAATTVAGAPVFAERSFDVVTAPGPGGWWAAPSGPRVRWGGERAPVRALLVEPSAPARVPGMEPEDAAWLVGPPGLEAPPGTTVELPVDPAWRGAAVFAWTGSAWEAVPVVGFGDGRIAAAPSRLGWFRLEARDRPPVVTPTLTVLASGPNPSAARSRVAFRISVEGLVTAEVFDVRGRRVRALLDTVLPAGDHDAAWDGTGESGSPVGAGIYFVRIAAAGAEPRSVKLVRLGGGS